jgi:pimeloyl-ACP methyl ester carboxylesterase|tara:strand:+ start:12643 stop:13587 length:945 start_codon:yes stop_codon:yes gene_type:complete
MMNFPKPRKIRTNGIELVVHEAGVGGIPLVLAHGWPELAYSWRYQIPALVEQGYHVIAPDQRGYGYSDQPKHVDDYDIHQLCADHVGLLDALGIEKAIYVGHDWGAIIIWQHALLHPDRVMGVANLSVPFFVRDQSEPIAFWEKMLGSQYYIVHFNRQPEVAAKAFEKNPDQFLRNMFRTKQWLDSPVQQPDGQSIIKMADVSLESGELMMSEADLAVFVENFQHSGFVAPCNWYRNFTRNWQTTANVEQNVVQPALMIYGAHDMVPQADMTQYVADLETHTLDCGHWIQQEKPEQTNEILLEWLNRKMRPLYK